MTKDYNDMVKANAPIVFAFVLGLAFLLLLVTFRSLVIPVKAIVLNLLSVGAAYGVLVLVFQDGHGEKLLGFESTGAIEPWLPLFLFVILFGLSMDYHVFILSRVREAFDRGMSTEDAVSHGIRSTASTVTSAAIVMVAVFGVFATLSSIVFKQLGIGLAVAILIDATLVRAILLPATMKLLGDKNWYLPKKLGWLPHIEHEPAGARRRLGLRIRVSPARHSPSARRPLAAPRTSAFGDVSGGRRPPGRRPLRRCRGGSRRRSRPPGSAPACPRRAASPLLRATRSRRSRSCSARAPSARGSGSRRDVVLVDRLDAHVLQQLQRGQRADPREPGGRGVEPAGVVGEPQRRPDVGLVHVVAGEPARGLRQDVEPLGRDRHPRRPARRDQPLVAGGHEEVEAVGVERQPARGLGGVDERQHVVGLGRGEDRRGRRPRRSTSARR